MTDSSRISHRRWILVRGFVPKSAWCPFLFAISLFCAPVLAADPGPAGRELTDSVGRNLPRLAVSASLLAWGVFAPEPESWPLITLAAGTPADRDAVLDTVGSLTALITIGTLGAGSITRDLPTTIDRLAITSSVVASSYALRTYLKGTYARPRPYVARGTLGPDDGADDFRSFPSGHTLLAWACVGDAVVRAMRGNLRPSLVAVLTAEALATSVLRVAAGEHYVGDVVAGAAIGLAAGSAVSLVTR